MTSERRRLVWEQTIVDDNAHSLTIKLGLLRGEVEDVARVGLETMVLVFWYADTACFVEKVIT